MEEQTSRREEGTSSSANGEGASSEKTRWEALTVSMRDRFIRFVGTSEGILRPPSEDPRPSLEKLRKAIRAAEAFVNETCTEDAVACLFAFEKAASVDGKGAEEVEKQLSLRGEASRTSSSVAVVGETPFVAPLIPSAREVAPIFTDAESLVATGAGLVTSVITGQNAGPEAERQQKGTAKFLGPWDRMHPDFQDMLGAIRRGDQMKLHTALADHMGRSSLKLDSLSRAQRAEYLLPVPSIYLRFVLVTCVSPL